MRLCLDALNNLPALIGMTILTPPFVVHANSNEQEGGKDPGGYSGFVMIKESHISVHTRLNNYTFKKSELFNHLLSG